MDPIRIHIPKDLFEPAATRHYEADLPPFSISMGIDEYSFAAPLHWQADITNTGGALLVSGTVKGTAKGSCARCLEDAVFDVEGEIEGYFLIPGQEADLDDLEEDEFDTLPADEMLDMAPLIEAALVLEMPLVPLCKDDCKGLCPKCGQNLNEGDCGCQSIEVAPANPFAALKDYKFD